MLLDFLSLKYSILFRPLAETFNKNCDDFN